MGSSQVKRYGGDSVQEVQTIVVCRVVLLATSMGLVVASIPTSFILSLSLFVIGGRLVREVLLCVDLSHRNRRSRGQSRSGLHK